LDTGRQVPFAHAGSEFGLLFQAFTILKFTFPSLKGWANDAVLGIAGPIIVDGAKRDR
jgi:hypothetical protein